MWLNGVAYCHYGMLPSSVEDIARNNGRYRIGSMVCNRIFFEDCNALARWDLSNCATSRGEKMVVLCERKTYHHDNVTIVPEDFPGPHAAGALQDDFGALGDFQMGGMEHTVRQYLEAAGLVDQWDYDPENPEANEDGWVLYEGRCFFQKLLKDYLGSMLSTPMQAGPMEFSYSDVALLGGGIRVSKDEEKIYFLIPNLNQSRDAEPDLPSWLSPPCTPRPNIESFWDFGAIQTRLGGLLADWYIAAGYDHPRRSDLLIAQPLLLDRLDFPKLVHHFLQSSPQAQTVGLKVECNMQQLGGINDCDSHGGDDDGDGFCNGGPHADYCPDTPTSANCDWDGDGIGDGTTWLMGRPAGLGMSERDPHCFGSVLMPGFQDLGEKTKQRLLNFACGGCDNCGRVANPDLWKENTAIPHDLDVPAELTYPGAAPVDPGTWQPDLDHDWVGDACDPDVDGDGYRNEFDCEPMNTMLGVDLDGDGVCEAREYAPMVGPGFDTGACETTCDTNFGPGGIYRLLNPGNPNTSLSYVDVGDCRLGCRIGELDDNCAPPAAEIPVDAPCRDVLDYCLDPDMQASNYQQNCTPDAVQFCAMQYANPVPLPSVPAQPDADDDGVGDKCDTGAFGLVLIPTTNSISGGLGGTVIFGNYYHGEKYTAQMRTYGGNAVWDQIDPPIYEAQTRTAFEVGACACNQDPSTSILGGNLDWLHVCWNAVCPDNIVTMRGEEDGIGHKYWNPLREPGYATTHANGCIGLSCTNDSVRIAKAADGSLVYGRRHDFSRDESINHLSLNWNWRYAKQAWWPTGTSYDDAEKYEYEASWATPNLVTRARATWPDYRASGAPPISYDYDQQTGVTYSPATLVDHGPGSSFGEVYLGPPFVISIIPGIVDLMWNVGGGAAWNGGLATLPGSGLARGQVATNILGWGDPPGDLLLYRYGTGGFNLKVAQRFAGAGLDPQAKVSAAMGAVDGGLWGLDDGLHQTVLVYQQPYMDIPTDPTHGGGTMVPARLVFGRLSEGEVVTLEDLDTLSGQAPPSLYAGRLVYLARGQQALVMGRAGSASGAWHLARVSLPSGEWSAPRPLPIAASDEVLSVSADPVSRRLLVVTTTVTGGGGAVAAPDRVLRALWVHPTTLAVTAAAPDAPLDLVRSRAAVRFDPLVRQVLIAGGTRDGTTLDDVWRLDLRRQTWTPVATLPEPLDEPLLYWDGARQVLWAGEPRADRAGLDVWAYSQATGAWVQTTSEILPPAPQWPVDDAYIMGRSYVYPYSVDATTALPGTVILGRLAADSPWLGVDIRHGFGETLSVSEVDPSTGDDRVAALCPPGQTCELVVRPEGGGTEPFVPFTLDAEPAALTPVALLPGPATSRSLSMRGDLLYLVGPLGLRIVRASTLGYLAFVVKLGLMGARAGALCGRHLCVVRPGPFGFKVVDVSRPESVSIVGHAFIGFGARDLAVWGSRAYVARGHAGVRLVDLSNPLLPVAAGAIASSGKAVSVAVRDGLLAVAHKSGVVKLYNVQGDPTEVGTVQAGFKVSKVRFVAGQLWLLDKHRQTVEAWRVDDPSAAVRVGTFQDNAPLLMTGRWRGTRLYAVDGLHLRVLQAQAQ